MIFPSVQCTNIEIYKYTNTQIQHKTCAIFSMSWCFKDNKNYIPMCQTHNYKFLAVCIQYNKCIFQKMHISLLHQTVIYSTDIYSPIVSSVYPIQTYIYVYIFLKMHIPQHPTVIYPPNTNIHISNTNIHIPKPCGRRAHRHHPTDTYPPIVGRIYQIPVYQTAYILQFWLYISNIYVYKQCLFSLSVKMTLCHILYLCI